VEGVLRKDRDTTQQSSIQDKEERRANVLGVYSLSPGVEVRGKSLLLVDDVVTSGSTLSACAKVLAEAGAEKVWCVTLAQAGK
jgi:predicted amidophosphoribosyltransferase